MKAAIRADASVTIGTGHVMRCLTLAEELRCRGVEILFICRRLPGNLIDLIRNKGYSVAELAPLESAQQVDLECGQALYSDWLGTSQEEDAKQTYQILAKQALWSWLIVDHYSLDERWEDRQKNAVDKILVIDDLANRSHNCNILLDQNYYIDMDDRYTKLLPASCQKLLGPRFSLLRKEFREQREKKRENNKGIKKILVFFGGADADNWTGKVLRAIVDLVAEEVIVNAVIGITNPHKEKLEALCAGVNKINLHVQASNMAQMMADADLSIGSGGTVTWERCCSGLPTIAWPVAENQKKLLKDSADAGLLYMPDNNAPEAEEIALHLNALLKNTVLCESMRVRGEQTIDGKGSIRVANIVCPSAVSLFVAGIEEMEKIFSWRNDPVVRQFSNNSEKISFEQHKKWYEKALKNPYRHILIGSISNKEVGVLRFDVSGDEVEISIYLVSSMFMKGHGRALIDAGEVWLTKNCPQVRFIVADVLPENKASMKLFESSSYQLSNMSYRKSLNDA